MQIMSARATDLRDNNLARTLPFNYRGFLAPQPLAAAVPAHARLLLRHPQRRYPARLTPAGRATGAGPAVGGLVQRRQQGAMARPGRYLLAETTCGSWAGFKLSRYLMQFTGQALYGD